MAAAALLERQATATNDRQRLMNEAEFCAMVQIEPATARNWRWRGVGPRFFRVGKLIRYRVSDVELWLADNAVGGESKAN